MSRTRWKDRDPDYLDRDGKPVYDRKAKVKIWSERLREEYFSGRKPSRVQKLQIAAAVCLILELSAGHEGFTSGKPLPKNYLAQFNTLQRLLESFRPKVPKGKSGQAAKDSGLGLAAILGGET